LSGKIYRFGGFNERYEVIRSYSSFDPAANKWTAVGTLPAAMAETHLGISNDGRFVYFAGGFAGNLNHNESPSQDINSNVYRFDPLTNTFTLITTLPQPRGAGTLDVLNGELHYMGGNPADRVTNVGDHFVYNLANKSWRTAAPLPNPKDHMSSLVLAGKIYVLGGEHGHDQLHQQQGDAHVYDPGTDRWTQIANLPTPKSHTEAGTFVSDGKIIMAGGQVDNFQPTSQVVAFDPLLDRWSVLPALPAPRQGAIIQRVDKSVVIAVGGVQTSEPQSNVWLGKLP
jgi:N-acetylneuraminic acid mutarotase